MIKLDPKDGYVVLINTFTMEPDLAEQFLEADPAARSPMQEAGAIANSFEPIYYGLRESHEATTS